MHIQEMYIRIYRKNGQVCIDRDGTVYARNNLDWVNRILAACMHTNYVLRNQLRDAVCPCFHVVYSHLSIQ